MMLCLNTQTCGQLVRNGFEYFNLFQIIKSFQVSSPTYYYQVLDCRYSKVFYFILLYHHIILLLLKSKLINVILGFSPFMGDTDSETFSNIIK